MKAILKTSLSFGLVSIPVKLYSAIQKHSLDFTMLHAVCHTPIELQRWCSSCKETVLWQDIVKGLKKDDGTYFVITQEALSNLKPESTDRIAIIEFVDYLLLKPILFDQHYYLGPAKKNDSAYFLLVQALKNLNKVAIAQYVLKEKEHICAIQAYETGLLLTTLNYVYEIRPISEIAELIGKKPDIMPEELRLAEKLITELTVKKFDINRFVDTFAQRLHKAINAKKRGIKINKGKATTTKSLRRPLVEILKESLQKNKMSQHIVRASAPARRTKKT